MMAPMGGFKQKWHLRPYGSDEPHWWRSWTTITDLQHWNALMWTDCIKLLQFQVAHIPEYTISWKSSLTDSSCFFSLNVTIPYFIPSTYIMSVFAIFSTLKGQRQSSFQIQTLWVKGAVLYMTDEGNNQVKLDSIGHSRCSNPDSMSQCIQRICEKCGP